VELVGVGHGHEVTTPSLVYDDGGRPTYVRAAVVIFASHPPPLEGVPTSLSF
jgi:hypothetical protein